MLIFSSIKLGSIHSHVSHGEIYLTASFGLAILTDWDSTSVCITFNLCWHSSKECLNLLVWAIPRQALEGGLQCCCWLFWVKTDVVSSLLPPSLALSLMRQPSITMLTILSFSNIRLSGRPHLTRPPSLSLLYIVENIKESFFSFSWPIKQELQSDEADMPVLQQKLNATP